MKYELCYVWFFVTSSVWLVFQLVLQFCTWTFLRYVLDISMSTATGQESWTYEVRSCSEKKKVCVYVYCWGTLVGRTIMNDWNEIRWSAKRHFCLLWMLTVAVVSIRCLHCLVLTLVCLSVVRVHLLEEQLRETEMRSADLLAEEQRRSREIIVCDSVSSCFHILFSVFVIFGTVLISWPKNSAGVVKLLYAILSCLVFTFYFLFLLYLVLFSPVSKMWNFIWCIHVGARHCKIVDIVLIEHFHVFATLGHLMFFAAKWTLCWLCGWYNTVVLLGWKSLASYI